eukprot:CAMPEP_0201591698 /NCGR_PEP_ID=MMETSP0190_2-20130828/189799_1 /ASSEMBLY_ACC=CAM_ASM_000263 /TAXON_ID=37353 /ORGANISM="Rosalina sp." /LENGTH=279 /DNA_ID=CAMNT_0048050139 /DNA_START=1349 /DNA_END=2188 /DNA_ORIENTATION=-
MSENKTLPWYDEPIPETAKDLIYQLLAVDPKKRITAKQIYKHPWINGYDTFQSFQQDEKKEDIDNNNDIDIDNNSNHNKKIVENDDSNDSISTNNVQQQLGSFELNKSGTSDSKQDEEQSQQTQNGEEEIIQNIIMPKPNAVTPHLSASVDIKDNDIDEDEDNDITMQSVTPSLSVTTTPSISNGNTTTTSTNNDTSISTHSSLSSLSTSNTASSLSSNGSLSNNPAITNTNSRKRRAHFDDDSDPQIVKPPAKKQRSDPNGIQQKDLIPVQVPTSNST